jgi:hypothetical protein
MKKLLIFLFTFAIGLTSTHGQYMNKWYGIKYDPTASGPAVTRIAEDNDLTIHHHDNLPIQNLMKGCLLLDNGVVNYYLHDDDWTAKEAGGASDLTGADGQVMVEIPAHYELFETVAGWNYVKESLTYKAGFKYVPKIYISAYKAALNRTTLKLSSVVNTTAAYYGADNSSTYAGYPATVISRTNFRTYARNRGANWSQMSYQAWKTEYWLFVIEFATRNCQAAVGSPDGSGYQTGGLGNGLTTLANWVENGYRPVAPCGLSNSLGNYSGEVAFTTTVLTNDEAVKIPRYRGIESPFGDIWEWMDGISIYHSVSPRASYAYIIDNPNYFSDGAVNLGRARAVISLALSSGYVATITFGSHGDPLPATIGADPTTYWCDYFYTPQNVGTAGWYAPLVGGSATDGATAGFGTVNSHRGASAATTHLGSRLCFLGS